jgi:hypothetical protein
MSINVNQNDRKGSNFSHNQQKFTLSGSETHQSLWKIAPWNFVYCLNYKTAMFQKLDSETLQFHNFIIQMIEKVEKNDFTYYTTPAETFKI